MEMILKLITGDPDCLTCKGTGVTSIQHGTVCDCATLTDVEVGDEDLLGWDFTDPANNPSPSPHTEHKTPPVS